MQTKEIDLRNFSYDSALLSLFPADFAYDRCVLPLWREGETLYVAMPKEADLELQDELAFLSGCQIKPVVVDEGQLKAAVEECYVDRLLSEATASPVQVLSEETVEDVDLAQVAQEAKTVRYVNLLFHQAVGEGASDIHLEPFEKEYIVRFRIDGVLHRASSPPPGMHAAIASRIKIMAGLDIAQRRLPQDGRIRLRIAGRQIDVRVSTIPTLYGESIVMRLLDGAAVPLNLEELGMDSYTLNTYRKLIKKPYGVILVTGPTGSGKTTTLYAALREVFTEEKKIITIEDPVEYQLSGVNQIPVQTQIGLTFARGLRSILRQDPDIVMVGEVRDPETAQISIQAALTGHLVFSTLHTNNAAGGITRLLEMGVEPYLVASTVEGIIAQRLVRLICPECREPYEDPVLAEKLGCPDPTFWRGRGCANCHYSGYRGRTGIFELLPVDEQIRELTLKQASTEELQAAARKAGMKLLAESGWEKVKKGLTTAQEVERVAGS
jgi:type II secretion system protein E